MKLSPRKAPKNLGLMVNFRKDGRQVVAYSPALDISTVGRNESEAKRRFAELVEIFFDDLIERNVVADVLAELGWKPIKIVVGNKQHRSWNPPKISQTKVLIPLPTLAS